MLKNLLLTAALLPLLAPFLPLAAILLPLAAIFVPLTAAAQQPLPQGSIQYDMSVHLRQQLAKQNAALAAMMPEEMHTYMRLTFRQGAYVLESIDAPPAKGTKSGTTMQIALNDERKKFVLPHNSTVRSEYILRKKRYYTLETLHPPKVSYSNEKKLVLGYTCTKAVIRHEGATYVVWFTRQLPYSYSPEPDVMGNIPGTVLEYSSDDFTCRATGISGSFAPERLVTTATARQISKEQLQDLQEDAEEDAKQQTQSEQKKGGAPARVITIQL